MQGVRRGTLLIADIGGYTNFLTAVELEHSTDILSDLIGAIVARRREPSSSPSWRATPSSATPPRGRSTARP
jgi:hypothetical protein